MKIGLTYTGSIEKHTNYINWLQEGDGTIEIIRLSADEDNLNLINECDALVLSGGVDIHPTFYGNEKLDYENAPDTFKKQRDEFEINMFNKAMENKIPVLGICRGLQLINTILGGTLKQDLGSGLNKIHWGEKKAYDKAHAVTVLENTLLKNITHIERGVVNSAHHQAINQLGTGLKANAVSDDGTIEGIEWESKTGKPFLLAVQWHPERMYQYQLNGSALSKNIRDYFIQAIKQQ